MEHCQVTVPPFTRVDEGEEIIIGHPAESRFVAVPPPVVDALDHLAAGHSVGETARWMEESLGEPVALEELLESLDEKGFVRLPGRERGADAEAVDAGSASRRFHFEGFPQPVAQVLFGRSALTLYGLVIAAGLAAVLARPQIVPGWRALFFPEHFLKLVSLLLAHHLVATFLHEMAHLVAARAVGVSSRLGISHRLWYLVAETDMTGVWALPRRRRFLPVLAGPLLDAVSASALLMVLFLADSGAVELGATTTGLAQGMTLRYLLGLVWQCYFFLRTDFYYVVANLARCRNLMGDTETYLRQRLRALLRGRPVEETPGLSSGERVAVRWYAAVWLAGRAAALGVLVLVQLPLAGSYLRELVRPAHGLTPDHLVLLATSLLGTGAGLWLWIRNLVKERTTS